MARRLWAGLLLGLLGCPATPTSPQLAAPAGAEVCEHGVAPTLCARCNPRLAAVYRAKGDWCEEHGQARSFCPTCNPEARGRPGDRDVSAEATADGAPAEGTRIRLRSKEIAERVGITTAPVSVASGVGGLRAPARLGWDAARVVWVTAPAGGVLHEVLADVGTRVEAGDRLGSVRSVAVGANRAGLVAAQERVAVAEAGVERARQMLSGGVRSAVDLREAELALAEARAQERSLAAALGPVGAGSGGGYALSAPRAGVVTRREVWAGSAVEAGALLWEIVDPRVMWATVDVADREVARVTPGVAATVSVEGLEGAFAGVVEAVAPSVDRATRTVAVRVRLDNDGGLLRADMFGEAALDVGGVERVFTVPADAVQRARGVDVVFVRGAEDEYLLRRVRVVAREGRLVRLTGGLAAGEPVVIAGSFLLKTEVLKDSLGAGCCDVE